MDTFWTWLPLAISAVAFLGAATVYLRGSADKGTMESQERLLETRGLEIEDLTRRLATTNADLVVAKARITALEAENRVLDGKVQHVAELVKIQDTIDMHHTDMTTKHGELMTALRSIASAVGET